MEASLEEPLGGSTTHKLRRLNIIVGLVAAAQAIVLLIIAKPASLPVNMTYMLGPPGEGKYSPPTELFGMRIDIAVALFLLLAAADHLIVASPWANRWYNANVARGINPARWWEYSISASLMVVLIAMLTGISEVTALGALFGVNAAMILFGLLMEHYESPGRPNWLPYLFGVLTGAVPWLLIGVYLWSPTVAAEPPGFVYAIYGSLFLFFNSFAVNMFLQYRRVGPWRNYLFGESAYILLSLTAKSALAWQLFAATLTA